MCSTCDDLFIFQILCKPDSTDSVKTSIIVASAKSLSTNVSGRSGSHLSILACRLIIQHGVL